MSEKRFSKLSSSIDYFDVWDSVEEKGYTVDEVVELLNEQQATIQSLKSDKAIAEDYANIFEKENVKLRKQIGEQQATISALKEENKQLKCINDQLEERLENSGIGVALKMDCDN